MEKSGFAALKLPQHGEATCRHFFLTDDEVLRAERCGEIIERKKRDNRDVLILKIRIVLLVSEANQDPDSVDPVPLRFKHLHLPHEAFAAVHEIVNEYDLLRGERALARAVSAKRVPQHPASRRVAGEYFEDQKATRSPVALLLARRYGHRKRARRPLPRSFSSGALATSSDLSHAFSQYTRIAATRELLLV